MKKFNKFLIALLGVLVTMAPFITQSASACTFIGGETEIPDCLK